MIKSRLKKWLCIGLISCTAVGAAFALSSCEKETATKDEYQKAYDLYVVYTEANGETPASYEDWLADIRGPRGAKGDKGDKGEKGDKGDKGDTPVITIGENGNWFVDGVDTGMPSCGEGVDHTHQWEEPIVLRPATCVEIGFSVQYCSVCEEDKVNVLSLAHLYDEGLCVVCDDLQTKGILYEETGWNTKEYTVIGYEGADTDIYIANEIDGIPVTGIDARGFWGRTDLTSITIPNSIETISNNIFMNCKNLTNINVSKKHTAYQSIDGNVYTKDGKTLVCYAPGKTQTSFTIPDSVTTITGRAFMTNTNLKNITISADVKEIGSEPFCACTGLTNITVAKENTVYQSIDGNLYTKDGKTLVYYAPGKTQTSFAIPNSVTTIGKYAFSGCTGLTNISIPNSVTMIGKYAFKGCKGLTNISISNSVTTIGNGAFSLCTGLTNVSIPNSVTTIGEDAFSGCTGLTSISISNSVTTIGKSAFGGCTGLRYNVKGNLKYLGNNENPYLYLESSASQDITTAIIEKTCKIISSWAFRNCTGLTSVTIHEGVTMIGYSAFEDCTGLTNVSIPNSVTTISYSAFSGCTGLQYNVKDNLSYLGNDENPYLCLMFGHGSGGTATIDKNCKVIAGGAFYYPSFTSITIPSSVTTIGEGAFQGRENLSNVYYEGTASDWEKMTIADRNDILENATRYYYVEKEADVPTDGGKYWHYDEEDNIVVWGE